MLSEQLNQPPSMNNWPPIYDHNNTPELFEPPLGSYNKSRKVADETDKDKIYYLYGDKMGIARLISMLCIVWGHSLLGWEKLRFKTVDYQIIQAIILETGKIGTISFFLITGYFLGDKIQTYTVQGYIKRRFFTLILPWFIFLLLFALSVLLLDFPYNLFKHANFQNTIHFLLSLAGYSIFYSVYWYVPVSVISVTALIIFKKYINTLWFGISLAVLTTFYSVNLYFGWVPENHTKSVLAYMFFIWLGYMLKNNERTLGYFLKTVSWPAIFPVFSLLFFVACFEAVELTKSGSADPFSTVRFSNIIVSLVMFLTLLKTEKLNWVNKFEPRKCVYGIYLVHCIILVQFRAILNYFIKDPVNINHLGTSMILQVFYFLMTFITSYFIVFLLRKSKLKFMIGGRQ